MSNQADEILATGVSTALIIFAIKAGKPRGYRYPRVRKQKHTTTSIIFGKDKTNSDTNKGTNNKQHNEQFSNLKPKVITTKGNEGTKNIIRGKLLNKFSKSIHYWTGVSSGVVFTIVFASIF